MGNLLVIPSIFAIFAKLIQSQTTNQFGLVFSAPRKFFKISDTCSGCVTFLLSLHSKQSSPVPRFCFPISLSERLIGWPRCRKCGKPNPAESERAS